MCLPPPSVALSPALSVAQPEPQADPEGPPHAAFQEGSLPKARLFGRMTQHKSQAFFVGYGPTQKPGFSGEEKVTECSLRFSKSKQSL